MDFAGDRLRQRPHLGSAQRITRQQRGLRMGFVQVFDDGHGLGQVVAIHLQVWDQHLR